MSEQTPPQTLTGSVTMENAEKARISGREGAERFNRVHKGETLNISAAAPGINSVMIGLGWDVIGFDTGAADLDASVFLLNKDDETRQDDDFVFFNHLQTQDGAVEHTGDNRTGAGDGDDETVFIDLDKISYDVTKIEFVVSIYDAEIQNHSFKDVRNVFFRLVDHTTGHEIFRYFMDAELSEIERATALKIGYMTRDGDSWLFVAEGELIEGGLARLATTYGIVVAGV